MLALSTINTLEKFPSSELLYHFHDGCCIAVKESQAKEFLDEISLQVEKTGELLGLKHPQKIELQKTYPNLSI